MVWPESAWLGTAAGAEPEPVVSAVPAEAAESAGGSADSSPPQAVKKSAATSNTMTTSVGRLVAAFRGNFNTETRGIAVRIIQDVSSGFLVRVSGTEYP